MTNSEFIKVAFGQIMKMAPKAFQGAGKASRVSPRAHNFVGKSTPPPRPARNPDHARLIRRSSTPMTPSPQSHAPSPGGPVSGPMAPKTYVPPGAKHTHPIPARDADAGRLIRRSGSNQPGPYDHIKHPGFPQTGPVQGARQVARPGTHDAQMIYRQGPQQPLQSYPPAPGGQGVVRQPASTPTSTTNTSSTPPPTPASAQVTNAAQAAQGPGAWQGVKNHVGANSGAYAIGAGATAAGYFMGKGVGSNQAFQQQQQAHGQQYAPQYAPQQGYGPGMYQPHYGR